MTKIQLAELYNLYHLARTALAAKGKHLEDSPYNRKLWASNEFHKAHPKISVKSAYLAFERAKANAAIPGFSVDALDTIIRRRQ